MDDYYSKTLHRNIYCGTTIKIPILVMYRITIVYYNEISQLQNNYLYLEIFSMKCHFYRDIDFI